MTSPDGGGQGTQGTYLRGTTARARTQAWGRLHSTPPPDIDEIEILTANIDLLEYWVGENGVPKGYPPVGAYLRTVGGVGAGQFTDVPPAAADIILGADARWLPTSESFAPDGTWSPQNGGFTWSAPAPDMMPYLDTGYSHEVRGGDEVSHNAVILDGDAWLQLDAQASVAGEFTVILVAVFHPNPELSSYSIIESSTTNETDDSVNDWGLRYEGGSLRFSAGSVRGQHDLLFAQGRAVFLALAIDPVQAKLVVASKTTTTEAFSTTGMNVFDLQLYLGRNGGDLNRAMTAQMDVLELSFYGRSLAFEEISDKLHLLDAVYGIVG